MAGYVRGQAVAVLLAGQDGKARSMPRVVAMVPGHQSVRDDDMDYFGFRKLRESWPKTPMRFRYLSQDESGGPNRVPKWIPGYIERFHGPYRRSGFLHILRHKSAELGMDPTALFYFNEEVVCIVTKHTMERRRGRDVPGELPHAKRPSIRM